MHPSKLDEDILTIDELFRRSRKYQGSAEFIKFFLICSKLGLETRSAEYIAGYMKSDRDLAQFSYELIVKVADKIEELFLKKWTAIPAK
jgi:hypothetical protein